jgi:hypothetical protein
MTEVYPSFRRGIRPGTRLRRGSRDEARVSADVRPRGIDTVKLKISRRNSGTYVGAEQGRVSQTRIGKSTMAAWRRRTLSSADVKDQKRRKIEKSRVEVISLSASSSRRKSKNFNAEWR